jgi:hypothetical protein
MTEYENLQGTTPVSTPTGSFRGLLRDIRGQAVQPRDPRVRNLWYLLRGRNLLNRSPRVRSALLFIWSRGLRVPTLPRQRAARLRIIRIIRSLLGLRRRLPAYSRLVATRSRRLGPWRRWPARMRGVRPLRRVALRPVARTRMVRAARGR